MTHYSSILWTATTFLFITMTQGLAQTATDSFGVQVTVVDDCNITATNTLDFGTQGALSAAVDATTTFQVQCTDGTGYEIALDAGLGTGATTTTRLLSNGGDTIDYQLFSDSGRTTNWGNTSAVDTVTGTGDGTTLTFTVYARMPAQDTPGAATYTDTIGITVTF